MVWMLLVILKNFPLLNAACPAPRTWASACRHAESFACCTCGERSLCRIKRPESSLFNGRNHELVGG